MIEDRVLFIKISSSITARSIGIFTEARAENFLQRREIKDFHKSVTEARRKKIHTVSKFLLRSVIMSPTRASSENFRIQKERSEYLLCSDKTAGMS